MAHPNVGPFVGRQLIQRFVTSDPAPGYVRRVAAAFDAGEFMLPDGTRVGEGRKGDLKAAIAAVLFDPDAAMDAALADDSFGKVREPLLRLTHFARAFDADMSHPEYVRAVRHLLAQLARPAGIPFAVRVQLLPPRIRRAGHAVGRTRPDRAGAPDRQRVQHAGHINLLSFAAFRQQREDFGEMRRVFAAFSAPFDEAAARRAFVPDCADALPLAGDSAALVNHLDGLLLYGSMTEATRTNLVATLDAYPRAALDTDTGTDEGRQRLVAYAITLVMASPDYLVQR